MKRMRQTILKELKQAIKSDKLLLIGETRSLSYKPYTKRLKPRKSEMFEQINGVLMRIGQFYIIREDLEVEARAEQENKIAREGLQKILDSLSK